MICDNCQTEMTEIKELYNIYFFCPECGLEDEICIKTDIIRKFEFKEDMREW